MNFDRANEICSRGTNIIALWRGITKRALLLVAGFGGIALSYLGGFPCWHEGFFLPSTRRLLKTSNLAGAMYTLTVNFLFFLSLGPTQQQRKQKLSEKIRPATRYCCMRGLRFTVHTTEGVKCHVVSKVTLVMETSIEAFQLSNKTKRRTCFTAFNTFRFTSNVVNIFFFVQGLPWVVFSFNGEGGGPAEAQGFCHLGTRQKRSQPAMDRPCIRWVVTLIILIVLVSA